MANDKIGTQFPVSGDFATSAALTAGLATKQNTGDYATNTALTTGLAARSLTTHNHSGVYATVAHAHAGVYAPAGAVPSQAPTEYECYYVLYRDDLGDLSWYDLVNNPLNLNLAGNIVNTQNGMVAFDAGMCLLNNLSGMTVLDAEQQYLIDGIDDAGICLRWGGYDGWPTLGFFGHGPVQRPSVSGSRGGNAALASLLTALANLGLIANSTTA
jgi:hypothetical protein